MSYLLKKVQRILQETNDHKQSYLSFSNDIHWAGSLFSWTWSLELAWLLALAKEERGVWSSDSAVSVGSSSDTFFGTASLISSISSSSEVRPERSD